jgi:putative transposase
LIEEEKKQIAVFRYGVIHEFVTGITLDHGEQERLLREKCSRKWKIPCSSRTRISRSTILNWVRRYKNGNMKLESLYPESRSDRGRSRAMDEDTCLAIIKLKKEIPGITVPFLLKTMEERGLISFGVHLNQSTVYRFLQQQGIEVTGSAPQDRRKFEAELPNDLWQSDVMHGPKIEINGKLRKTYLIAIIDDHSRLIPQAQFYFSEALSSYLISLEEAFLKRGLPRKLYVDNGPAFRSNHLEHITASLNVALIHAKPYQPQGKGKIERWFKTVRTSFLPGFKGNTIDDLNEAIDLWIEDIYHRRKHGSTGQTPFERFTSNLECIRKAPDDLENHFRKVARRKVANDRSIAFQGRLYEAPVSLIGKRIELLYHENDLDQIEVKSKGKSYGIVRLINLHVNCRVKRDENNMRDVIISSSNNSYKSGKLL